MRGTTNTGPRRWMAAAACGVLAWILASTVWQTVAGGAGLAGTVADMMPLSGVDHPVTAVLLNFRSYDTWMELGVLLLGWLGVLAARGEVSLAGAPMNPASLGVLGWFVRAVVPMFVLVAGYLLWLGKFAPGGAFQAGVVGGAAGVLLWLAGYRSVAGLPPYLLKSAAAVGFGAFALLAALAPLAGAPMLTLPAARAGEIILLLETLAAVSIAVTIAALLIGIHPAPGPSSERDGR
jgi:multisubunit Na+/H+ antiporter MnhB subunit